MKTPAPAAAIPATLLVTLLVLGAASPCAAAPWFGSRTKEKTGAHPAEPRLVWPQPPDEPRIAYVQSITKPSDLGAKISGLRKFANWIAGAREGDEPFSHPFSVALDEVGNLCITDTGANVVCFYDKAAKRWYRWEKAGDVRFASPVSAAKTGKTIFVADSALPAVLAFDLEGKLLFRVSDGLMRPTGIAVAGSRLLVADAGAHSVVVLDLNGKVLRRFGTRGAGNGEFNFPTHIAADTTGKIFVTDSMNGRVQVFNAAGEFQRQIGRLGDNAGSFSRPKGVAVDADGRIYVVDAIFNNFQIFNSEGRLLLDIGHPGKEPGEFWLPNGIAVSRDGTIYVADSYNGRVQAFQYVNKK
jgi:DNA-binding beta-propeller fold protein YncE